MTTPAVSVVVAAFDADSTLSAAVRSALDQVELDVEVIVVDDASRDATRQVAGQLASDPRVTISHLSTNVGPSKARNEGLRRATAPLVVFLDADDRLLPGALARMVDALGDHDVAVLGRFVAVDDDGVPLDIGTWAREQLRPVLRRGGRVIPAPSGFTSEALLTRLVSPPPGGVMVRRTAALSIGGFDSRRRRSEDLDFLVRLRWMGTFACVDEEVVVYRRGGSQRSASIRHRQFGRQATFVSLICRAPTRRESWARARGVRAHHLDRATVRWREGDKSRSDVLSVLRSLALALGFGVVGTLSAARPWPWRNNGSLGGE